MKTLTISGILTNSFQLGLKQAGPLFLASLLWLLTIWIPYINVGTTIGMIGLIIAMGRGEKINPSGIFNAKYRSNIGEFFLLIAFMIIGISSAFMFLVIPGIVLQFAWILAPYLLIDKNLTPLDSIKQSNELTNGYKWTIFFGLLIYFIAISIGFAIVAGIIGFIFGGLLGSYELAILAYIPLWAIMMSLLVSVYGYIYSALVDNSNK